MGWSRWNAVERSKRPSDLGVWRGQGRWGVSTLNPTAVGDIYVTLSEDLGSAISYAKERAYQSGEPYERDPERRPGEPPHPSVRGRIYYVFEAPRREMAYEDIVPLFRALRGRRGGVETLIVEKNTGLTAHDPPKIRWKKARGLEERVPDYEAEMDIRAARRKTEQIAPEDRTLRRKR